MFETKYQNLKKFNISMGLLHLGQFFIMFFLSKEILKTIYFNLPKPDTARRIFEFVPEKFIDINLGQTISFFLLFSAIAHLILVFPPIFRWYINNIKLELNLIRWYEYAFSSSLMVFVIANLCGINDAATLILLFCINACMNLFGAMMEKQNSLLKQNAKEIDLITIENNGEDIEIKEELKTSYKTDWTSFIYGCFAGIIPWLIMGLYFFTSINRVNGNIKIPDFVYWVFPTLFVFFNLFAINMFLQYKKIGNWKNYLFGEYAYIVLSLVAKTVLAWLIWGGTLR